MPGDACFTAGVACLVWDGVHLLNFYYNLPGPRLWFGQFSEILLEVPT